MNAANDHMHGHPIDDYVKHYPKLRIHLMRKLNKRDYKDVEDMLQEVGIRYWRRVVEPDIPEAYLYQISNHVLADYLERKKYVGKFEVEDLGGAVEETTGATMDDTANRIDLEQRVARLLAPVKCVHRAVLILHKMYGYSYEDVARELGISIFTVEKYLTEGKSQLRAA